MTLAWHWTSKVNFKVKGCGTEYRPKIPSARVPKWFQVVGSIPEQLTQQQPLTGNYIFKVKFKDGVPDIVPKLRQQVYQNRPK